MSGTYQVILKITLTYTRPSMFNRLHRRNNSHSVKEYGYVLECKVLLISLSAHFLEDSPEVVIE